MVAVLLLAASACTSSAPSRESPVAASSSAEPGAVTSGVTPAREMATARAAHSATALMEGRVLIAGGFDDAGSVEASAELYDPATGRFEPASAMSGPRSSHTATLLGDGSVLIAGGFDRDGSWMASAEIYEPATGQFSPTGSMAGPRADHTATLLDDGRVLIAGGTGAGYSFLATAELFDPETGTFSPTGSLSVPRESATATRLDDGRVLVAGGHAGRHESIRIYASAETYDPARGRFVPAGGLSIPRHKHDAVLLADGRVLIVGGSDERDDLGLYASAELFDPVTGTFSATGRLGDPRYKMRGTTVLLADGRALVCCGAAAAETFDPARGTFAALPGSFGAGPLFAAAARVGPEEILVTGGYSLSGPASAGTWLVRA